VNDVVNIGSDFEMTIKDLAEMIINITASTSRIVHLPPLPEGDMTRRKPDISKMRQLLPRGLVTIEDGVKNIISHRLK
jgi:UDP-glucose 4-epimerase